MPSAHDVKDDPAYHQLFGHSRMVVELLRLHTPPELQESLNLQGGILSLNTRHHPTLQDKREGDRTFLVARHGEPQALLVRLEFQSTQDADMNLRVALYNALLWQDLRTGKTTPTSPEGEVLTAELPLARQASSSSPHALLPILPFVIYNGEERWHGRQGASLRDRVELGSLRGLAPLQLDASFLLIDIRHTELPAAPRGPLDVLFALERLRDDPAEADRVLRELLRILPNEPEHASLREAFRRFIIGVLKARGIKLPAEALSTLEGIVSNFATSIENYGKKAANKGRQEGRQEGREEGRLEALRLFRAALQKLEGVALSDEELDSLMVHLVAANLTPEAIEAAPLETVLSWTKPQPTKPKKR